MPLLQRPIGRSPQLPGVIGTRTAMLSLLAVWLITAPSVLPRFATDETLRRATRWTSVVLFSLAFGFMLGAQGLWPSEMPPFRLLLVAVVELPAALLIYLYLARLARHVPGQARRETLARLAWLVPAVIAAAVIVLFVQWWDEAGRNVRATLPQNAIPWIGTLYGAAAVSVGVAATAAVGSLAVAFFHAGFPTVRRSWLGSHLIARGLATWRRTLTESRVRAYSTVLGAVLLVLAMVVGLDGVLWLQSNGSVAGNLPFVNFPGPKVWASAVVMNMGYRGSWTPLLDRWALIALNLAAVWLLAAQARPGLLRTAVRWGPVALIGAALGAIMASRNGAAFGVSFYGAWSSRLYTVVVVTCELPATVLLYLMLARLARDLGRTALAREFVALAVVMVALVGLSLVTFRYPLPGWHNRRQEIAAALFLSAAYGAAALVSAVWAVTCLARLGRAAVSSGEAAAPIERAETNSPPRLAEG